LRHGALVAWKCSCPAGAALLKTSRMDRAPLGSSSHEGKHELDLLVLAIPWGSDSQKSGLVWSE
jgi:hypothetical protein